MGREWSGRPAAGSQWIRWSWSGVGALALVHGESGGGVKGAGRHGAFLFGGFVGFESLVLDVEVEQHQFLLGSFVKDEVLPEGCWFVGSICVRHGGRRALMSGWRRLLRARFW